MLVWRLCSSRRAARSFDGEGARLYGGRWNRPGTAMVYTAATLSLAALELFAHLEPEDLAIDLIAVSATIPDALEIERLEPADLPRAWRRYPAPESLQALGSAWAESRRTAVLSVPSAIIPQERNYLLNPLHPDFRQILVGQPERFKLDPRTWQARPRESPPSTER